MKITSLEQNTFFAVMTYGNVAMGSVNHIMKVAGGHGINFDYIHQIRMLDNSLNYYDMEKQLKSLPKKQVVRQLGNIVEELNNRVIRKPKTNPILEGISSYGYRAYRKSIIGFEKKFYCRITL